MLLPGEADEAEEGRQRFLREKEEAAANNQELAWPTAAQ